MARRLWAGITLAACTLILSSVPANAQEFFAKLSGFQEVGGLNAETGAILSPGDATLKLTLDKTAQTVTYTLTYSFPTTTTVTQSHIHFGKEHVPGNIMVYFCVGTGVAPPPSSSRDSAALSYFRRHGDGDDHRARRDGQGRHAERVCWRLRGAGLRDHFGHGLRKYPHRGFPGGRDPRADPSRGPTSVPLPSRRARRTRTERRK